MQAHNKFAVVTEVASNDLQQYFAGVPHQTDTLVGSALRPIPFVKNLYGAIFFCCGTFPP